MNLDQIIDSHQHQPPAQPNERLERYLNGEPITPPEPEVPEAVLKEFAEVMVRHILQQQGFLPPDYAPGKKMVDSFVTGHSRQCDCGSCEVLAKVGYPRGRYEARIHHSVAKSGLEPSRAIDLIEASRNRTDKSTREQWTRGPVLDQEPEPYITDDAEIGLGVLPVIEQEDGSMGVVFDPDRGKPLTNAEKRQCYE